MRPLDVGIVPGVVLGVGVVGALLAEDWRRGLSVAVGTLAAYVALGFGIAVVRGTARAEVASWMRCVGEWSAALRRLESGRLVRRPFGDMVDFNRAWETNALHVWAAWAIALLAPAALIWL